MLRPSANSGARTPESIHDPIRGPVPRHALRRPCRAEVRSPSASPPGARSSGIRWCVLVGMWSLVFAAPHFYWTLGGRAGARRPGRRRRPRARSHLVRRLQPDGRRARPIAGAVMALVLATGSAGTRLSVAAPRRRSRECRPAAARHPGVGPARRRRGARRLRPADTPNRALSW